MFLNIGLYLELKKFIEDNNYICPNTNKWLELFHLLQVAPVHNKELNLEVPYLQDKMGYIFSLREKSTFL